MVINGVVVAQVVPNSCQIDNEIKNYWNSHIKRKHLSTVVNPVTDRPLNEVASHPDASTTTTIATATTTKTISFSSQYQISSNKRITGQERCPDLNLELRISPPCPKTQSPQKQVQVFASPLASGSRVDKIRIVSTTLVSIVAVAATIAASEGAGCGDTPLRLMAFLGIEVRKETMRKRFTVFS
ncbi:hypothetical protein Cgig2_021545 [Carnegiea gigantea]|uniref:HTH myb-type domain-containing protein n=1 Tax=Carnegiea gigantea TaxID=171969 RepID=A0A9Q1GGP2_9CARY|nr:hypothetical protein Cgig2_021545 [Carnegiea gigantea]